MDIAQITEAIQRDVVWVVFANVLMQQMGLPVPAVPTLLLAGSLVLSPERAAVVLAAAVAASVIADWVWYLAGRAFGYRVLSGLCKLSINPGSCVADTESRFLRWGAWSLVIAKFVPGFSTVAPPIAGALRVSLPSFLTAAAVGALLWAGAAVLTGWLLKSEVQALIALLSQHGTWVIAGLLATLVAWLAWKAWQKYRFERLAAIPHISPDELMDALASEEPPLFLDLRGSVMIAETGPVVGATAVTLDQLWRIAGSWPKDRRIVTMCACPGDATAVKAARHLLGLGYTSVQPLRGGYGAWVDLAAEGKPQGT